MAPPHVGANSSGRPVAVYGAAGANLVIAIAKYVVAAVTGSSAMLAEAIHSTVDTANELLLLLGVWRSRRPPDELHPYGHGKELYFWGLIVAVVIFGMGGGMSIYEGISRLASPRPIEHEGWSYLVLGIAVVFEGGSWLIAFRELSRAQNGKSFWRALHTSKDPAVFSVIAEDSAALAGIVIAFLGIFLGKRLDLPQLDGIASILIGVLLAATAVLLVYESRGLLVGEAADPEVLRDIRRLAADEPAIGRVRRMLTMHLGPEEILLNMEVDLRAGLSSSDVVGAVDRLEKRIRAAHPEVKRVFIEAEALAGPRAEAADRGRG